MTANNGASHHNVEDILASIRTSIADETGGFRSEMRAGQAVPLRRDTAIAEEAADFELPAIFKPGHQATQPRQNIFGRLSDVLKTTPEPEPDRSRTVIRFEPAGSAARMAEQPQASQPRRTQSNDDPVEKAQHENDGMKRIMPTFFDTRINRMGEASNTSNAPKVVETKPEPIAAPQPPVQQPPRLPEPSAQGSAGDFVEDAAAQLLRPILKQWLTENMPKIVERALRSETGPDFPPPSHDSPRKTLR